MRETLAEDGALAERGRALELHVLDPVRDTGEAGISFRLPTRYQVQNEATGAPCDSRRMTRSPFPSVRSRIRGVAVERIDVLDVVTGG